MGHLYIALTLLFTVYGQLVIKWQIDQVGALPSGLGAKMAFLLGQLGNVWILSGFAAAFVAALAWMAAMTHFDLGYAYPFMGMAFILVMVFSTLFLGEALTWPRVAGTLLVVGGLVLITR